MSLAALLSLVVLPAMATPLPGQNARGAAPLASCTVETDSRANPADKAKAESDDEEEDDSDTSDADEEEASGGKEDPPVTGFLGSDGVTCVGMSGSISASSAVQAVKQPRIEGVKPVDNFDFATTFSLDIDSSTPFGASYLTTGFSMTLDAESEPLLTRATIGWGQWLFGYDSSQFTFWDGGDFAGSALSPQQSATQIMRRFDLFGDVYASVSLESFATTRVGGGSQTSPDKDLQPALVAAIGHEGARLNAKLAFLARAESEGANGATRRAALAANAGATWDFASGASISVQATIADNAPELLGTRFDRRSISDFGVTGLDTLGWSGLIAGALPLSETVTANAYVSFFRFHIESQPQVLGGTTSWRMAANLSWEPVERFSIALEAGATLLDSRLAAFGVSASGEKRTGTLTLTIQRSF